MQINRNFKYYVAGLFDGEGTVGRTYISIANVHKHLLLICAKYLKTIKIKSTLYKRKKLPNRLLCYTLNIWVKKIFKSFII